MKKIKLTQRLRSLILSLSLIGGNAYTQQVERAEKLNSTTIEIQFSDKHTMLIDFYGNNIFRMFQDNTGGKMRMPKADPPAEILVPNARQKVSKINIDNQENCLRIYTPAVEINWEKEKACFTVKDVRNGHIVAEMLSPIAFYKNKVNLTLKETPNEYFYGGGVQNGRFSHKGKIINIVNENSWVSGGVASPKPFYWSTNGYGFMWHTFAKGRYDFGSNASGQVKIEHETPYLDVFFMVSATPIGLLKDYYQLTGNPVLIPKFGFYEGHLNAYNRDYWKEDKKGILFEDGKKYKESQKDNGGIKESLNGEKNNYPFSARAVIDRYKAHDMPLGWILPNDGYGAGYGQTNTLEGNIQNLKTFGDYARKNGVELGLWTQSDLHPKPEIEPLLQRDIINEVKVAGVRILKTDVAWVGTGYSFGLNGVQEVSKIMPQYGANARPFIISLDGWAGTQHYATIWSGDQTGGEWEYIRFHIPTYIGSGLSGQPNITSDMDGIFGGKKPIINTRDFQWKTFTPMQLNMDGWGANPKYPHIMGEPTTSINRNYLKLKSELLPYTYTIAHQAINGAPIIRALFLEEANPYTLGKATQYEYMYGPYFLIAPIYKETRADTEGNDIRNAIYLPKGKWIDYFSGEVYDGGQIINNFNAPVWKLPVFVKAGAIIPKAKPNNNVREINKEERILEVYPYEKSSFMLYDDDGTTEAYKHGAYTQTQITMLATPKGKVTLNIAPTKGNFAGFEKNKTTEICVNTSSKPKNINVYLGKKSIRLREVKNQKSYAEGENVYYYNASPDFNRFSTKGSSFAKQKIIKNPQLLIKIAKTDVTQNGIQLTLNGYKFNWENQLLKSKESLQKPVIKWKENAIQPYALHPSWEKQSNADFYEIELQGMRYSTITENHLLIENLLPEHTYQLKLRAVNKSGTSPWEEVTVTTQPNPLQFAIQGIGGRVSVPIQEGFEAKNLFDRSEGTIMHTQYRKKAIPFDVIIDLKSFNEVDRLQYLPRADAGNGTFLRGSVSYSTDKKQWTKAGDFVWEKNANTKNFEFKKKPKIRYVKITVNEAVGNYGSGREIYVFKVPGTESYIPGDINNDGKIDANDFTSYTNYTGLKKGDADFEGYISRGDVNGNGYIDAFDISHAALHLNGGILTTEPQTVQGKLTMKVPKESYRAGEEIRITIEGNNLKDVNALGFALPYDMQKYEYISVTPKASKEMENLTNDRLHTNGEKVLYPTFVNAGEQPVLNGKSVEVMTLIFKAKRALKFDLKMQNILLVDRDLNTATP